MTYFASSAWNYIERKIRKLKANGSSGRQLLVTVPGLPEEPMLSLAESFANKCAASETLKLTLKVADVVTDGWSSEGRGKCQINQWLTEGINLTYYRSNLPIEPGKIKLIILCGADRVTDSGSLSDFHRCDLDTVWQIEMRGSFQSWIRHKLRTIGLENVETDRLRDFDRVLKPLIDQGRADLLQLSDWLASLNLETATNVGEAFRIMLGSLDPFQLPKFTGFRFGQKRASLAPYIEKANSFFSYTLFLDSKERDKAVKAIRQILHALDDGEDTRLPLDDEGVRGPYASGRLFIEGIGNYISTENRADRDKLRQCDFVTIMDKILKFRRKGPTPPPTAHKLSGSPIEIILHSVWQTFREFGRSKEFLDARVQRIEIASDRFKHDYEDSEEGEQMYAVLDRTEVARRYLLRLLGGVDMLVIDNIFLPGRDGELPVACKLADEEVACVYGKTAEPTLEFSVYLLHDLGAEPFRRKFAWRLPEIQPYRLAESLIHRVKTAFDAHTDTWKLPAFHLPYYEELLRATDDEETRRVMLHCVRDARLNDNRFTNLLTRQWLSTHDPLLGLIKLLAEKYALFITAAHDRGLHAALFSEQWTQLRQSYSDACRSVIQDDQGAESQMTPMLLRCFLAVQMREMQLGGAWGTEPFERSGVATVLHPAVLEMLEAQILFLFACFNAAGSAELCREDRRKAFAEKIWNGYVDLASIQSPIAGLLYNEDLNLDTNVRGQELIHRIGSPEDRDTTLSTRLLVRYDNSEDDEDMTDADMFRESRESKLLFRLMMDYFRLHPHARDGLNLSVFRNQDIQPIIAAVHQYLNKLADMKDRRYYVLSPERRKPYAISVTIWTESGDDVDVARWIEQWRERWEAAETENKFQAYRNCRFAVAHRIIETKKLTSFQSLIKDSFEADIAVLYNFIGAGQAGNKFSEVVPFDATSRTLKFPILEKSCCAVRHPIDSFKRARVISNRQFSLGTLHTQVMHRLKNQGVQPGKEFVIQGWGDFAPWRGIVDALHTKAEWVICIDPNIDERLVKVPADDRMREREIIGFGSGVGAHGEANFTISTEQFSLLDVQARLSSSIESIYSASGWTRDDCEGVTTSVLREARKLSGLSLVRATGVGHYVRDFMAYSLTRKIFREQQAILCDHLISLDAYRHWFDMADDERRPDLMWLTAWLDQKKRINLNMRLIECKLGQQSEVHLVKARAQINNGLRVLVPAFAPRSVDVGGEDNRPDQRYWWLQLHRLIASKAEIDNSQQADVLSALERLAEGDYIINWDAAVLAFWNDSDSADVTRIGQWSASDREEVIAGIYTMGSEFVRKLALEGVGFPESWDEWVERSRKKLTNVCDELDDIALPAGEEDDEDAPAWEDQMDPEEHEIDSLDDDSAESYDTPEPGDELSSQDAEVVTSVDDTIIPKPTNNAPTDSGDQAKTNGVETLSIPERVLLGTTVGGSKPIYWEFGSPQLANRHMLIFGTSGMGKSYAIQCLLNELGRLGQNSLVIDYTDGFIPSKLENATTACLNPTQHFIQQKPLPISPFRAQVSEEAGIIFKDSPMIIAKRVAAIFKSVYDLGNQQFPVLIDAITEGVEHFGDGFTLNKLLDLLQGYIDDGVHGAGTVRTTLSKLKPFIQSNPFASGSVDMGWKDLLDDVVSRCHVFQFFKVDRHSARALIEFIMWDLYGFVSTYGNKDIPRVVVLDEVQNLDLGPDAPVAKYLTEGRKHGIALITATQTVKQVGGVNDARVSRLFQAEHKLFFKPTENEIREHAQLLHNAIAGVNVQEWTTRLASLQLGECWSLGRSSNDATSKLLFQAHRIRIASLESRGFNG